MLNISQKLSASLLIGAAAMCGMGPGASAQPLTLRVSPSAPRVFTDNEGTWERIPASQLWPNGPR